MPIGTKSTAILLKQYQPKITRQPKTTAKHNFWAIFFETLLITAVTVVAGTLTEGVASGFVASLGASQLTVDLTAFAARTLVEFGVNQAIDAVQNEVTPQSTLLNLGLTASFNAGIVTRGFRTAKILRLAKNTKVLEKLGVAETRNVKEIIDRLSNTQLLTKEINGKKELFNFGKLNREQVLQDIGFVAQEVFKYDFKNLTAAEIEENLLLQTNLAKLSPKLLPKQKIKDLDNINNFLARFGTDYETVIKMNQFDWLNLISTIQKTNSGKSLILTLQQIRNNTVRFNFSNRFLSNSLNRINRLFKYFDFNYYIDKTLNWIWEESGFSAVLKEKLLILDERIAASESKALAKIKNLVSKGKQVFTRAEKVAVRKFNLIPLDSPVFLAVKIDPLNFDQAAITIFHKDASYDPIPIVDTIEKAEIFINQNDPFSWYWNESGWRLSYGIDKHEILNLVNFLPVALKKIVQEGLRINFQIKKLKQQIDRVDSNKLLTINVKKSLVNRPINFFFRKTGTKALSPLIRETSIRQLERITTNNSRYVKHALKRKVAKKW